MNRFHGRMWRDFFRGPKFLFLMNLVPFNHMREGVTKDPSIWTQYTPRFLEFNQYTIPNGLIDLIMQYTNYLSNFSIKEKSHWLPLQDVPFEYLFPTRWGGTVQMAVKAMPLCYVWYIIFYCRNICEHVFLVSL